jgi:hypothetical protein
VPNASPKEVSGAEEKISSEVVEPDLKKEGEEQMRTPRVVGMNQEETPTTGSRRQFSAVKV